MACQTVRQHRRVEPLDCNTSAAILGIHSAKLPLGSDVDFQVRFNSGWLSVPTIHSLSDCQTATPVQLYWHSHKSPPGSAIDFQARFMPSRCARLSDSNNLTKRHTVTSVQLYWQLYTPASCFWGPTSTFNRGSRCNLSPLIAVLTD